MFVFGESVSLRLAVDSVLLPQPMGQTGLSGNAWCFVLWALLDNEEDLQPQWSFGERCMEHSLLGRPFVLPMQGDKECQVERIEHPALSGGLWVVLACVSVRSVGKEKSLG